MKQKVSNRLRLTMIACCILLVLTSCALSDPTIEAGDSFAPPIQTIAPQTYKTVTSKYECTNPYIIRGYETLIPESWVCETPYLGRSQFVSNGIVVGGINWKPNNNGTVSSLDSLERQEITTLAVPAYFARVSEQEDIVAGDIEEIEVQIHYQIDDMEYILYFQESMVNKDIIDAVAQGMRFHELAPPIEADTLPVVEGVFKTTTSSFSNDIDGYVVHPYTIQIPEQWETSIFNGSISFFSNGIAVGGIDLLATEDTKLHTPGTLWNHSYELERRETNEFKYTAFRIRYLQTGTAIAPEEIYTSQVHFLRDNVDYFFSFDEALVDANLVTKIVGSFAFTEVLDSK